MGILQDNLPPIGFESPEVSDYFEKDNADEKRNKAQAVQLRNFLNRNQVQDEDIKNGLDVKTQRLELFEDVSKLVSKERRKRGFFGVQLDPNHSHFIFADDGGLLNFGGETRLRADIESCVAGNFKMVGIDNGSGGIILQRVDQGISAMLENMNQGRPWGPSALLACHVLPKERAVAQDDVAALCAQTSFSERDLQSVDAASGLACPGGGRGWKMPIA